MTCTRWAYTLVELLVVISIMVLLAALVMGTSRGDRRLVPVQQAARELAQTFRQARALAIEQQAAVAVSFNIQNAPGTSGKVLNNWSGGHWYQLVSSFQWVASSSSSSYLAVSLPPRGTRARSQNKMLVGWNAGRDTPASAAVDRIRSCFVGDRRVLPARQVRFLALTDQDNGGLQYRETGGNTYMANPWGRTYPRPWFGIWDPVAKRLFGWGGYDHGLRASLTTFWDSKERKPGGQPMSPSGFYYEGNDGAIAGSVHPRDRWIISDVQGNDGVWMLNTGHPYMPQDAPITFGNRFFTAGDPRPLVNGEWMDHSLEFHPDGSVRAAVFGGLRMDYSHGANWSSSFSWPDPHNPPATTGAVPSGPPPWDLTALGPGDMCPIVAAPWWTVAYENFTPKYDEFRSRERADGGAWMLPASSYVERTGWYWVTLAPDAEQDGDRFADAQAAWRTVMPAVRVGVSRYGEVRIAQVWPSVPAALASTHQLDPVLRGAVWENLTSMPPLYQRNVRTDAAGAAVGVPAEDFLTLEMLAERAWWMVPK